MPRNTRIRPFYRQGERKTPDRRWRSIFLDTLAETSNVSEAARRAGVNPSRAYKVRREEPQFRAKWNAALLEGYAHLELETLHRLRMGVDAGKEERKFDIANALRLLTFHRESVAREKALSGEETEESVLAELNARLEAMRARATEAVELHGPDLANDETDHAP